MGNSQKLGTAVITGASSGLGAVFAERLAKRGYDLKLVARRQDRLIALAEKLQDKYAVRVTTLVADLSSVSDIEKIVNDLSNDKDITLLINNAGTSTMAPLTQTPWKKQKAMIDVNITAVVLLTNAVLPGFVDRNTGVLINISSVMALHSLPVSALYSASKAFVSLYTRGLQQELKDTGIQVQLVNPSATATEIWEVGGVPLSQLDENSIMTVEDCVDAALSGLDNKELESYPSVESLTVIEAYDKAASDLFAAAQSGKPASRYNNR